MAGRASAACDGSGSVPPVQNRLATADDAEAIRRIYNPEVVGSTVTFDMVPRTPEDQLAWMDEHSGAHPAVVAVDDSDGRRVRVAVARTAPGRPTAPRSRTRSTSTRPPGPGGRAGCCSTSWCRLAAAHGFHAVMARIVGGHEASIALHRACGFELVGVEREVGRKFGRWLDVVLMQRLLSVGSGTVAARRGVSLGRAGRASCR